MNAGVDPDDPLFADWRTVHRALSVPSDDTHACVGDHVWCHGPNSVDLDAATLGACAVCVAISTEDGGVSN